MKKRFLCLLMALCLIAVLLPVTALADEKPDAKWDFALSGNAKAPEDDQAELVMKAGDEAKYYVTKQSDPNFPDNWYLAPGSDTEWNVKFEYPADGIPTITMKDAKIVNGCGLWFGGYNIPMTSDVKMVLEGSNYMSSAKYAGPLVFRTSGTATVTGSGKLEVTGNTHSMDSGYIASYGNLVLDHANITMNFPESWGRTNGLSTRGGDIIMKGGTLTVVAYDDPKTTHDPGKDTGYGCNQESFFSAVYAKKREDGTGGNFTVQDGATYIVLGSPVLSKSNNVELNKGQMIYVEGKFTIKDSTVELALVGKVVSASLFGAKPTMEYTNDTYYVVATKTKQPTFAADTATATPDMDKVVDYFSHTSLGQLTYFKVTPGGTGGPTSAQPPVVEEEEWVPPVEDTPTTGATTTKPTTSAPTTSAPTTSKPTTAPTQAPTKATDSNTTQAPTTTDKDDTDAKENSGNSTVILVIVICAVVIAGSGFALYWFVFRKPKK